MEINPMLRSLYVVLTAGALLVWMSPGAADDTLRRVFYHGIRATDPNGRTGLRNPERGLRTETLVAEPIGADVWVPSDLPHLRVPPGFHPNHWIRDMERFSPDGLTLAQMYCYLTDYADRPLSEEKLALLQQTFDLLRERGFKAVLRFAYEKTNDHPQEGPQPEWILRHIEQLKPVIAENADVIYVLQAGFIGAWGEWHSATHIPQNDLDTRAKILGAILDLLPPGRMTQVRVPKYKYELLPRITGRPCELLTEATAFTDLPEARVGYHNDGVLAGPSHGGTWPEGPLYGSPGNPDFDRVTVESAWVPVDGELFWSDLGWDGREIPDNQVEGMEAIRYLRLHHFSSFSVAHSYSEREIKNYAIDRWRKTPVDRAQLAAEHLPISDGWFEDAYGEPVERTVFEYIRDHLGYRFELQWAEFPAVIHPGGEVRVTLELINRGFSTLYNPRQAFIVLIPRDEATVRIWPVDADPRRWYPSAPGDSAFTPLRHRVTCTFRAPEDLPPDGYMLGLWLPDPGEKIRLDPRYAVRLANRDTAWWTDLQGRYGVNVLGTLRVEP